MKKLLLLLFVPFSFYAKACLNESHVNKSGKVTIDAFNMESMSFNRAHNKAELELYLKNLRAGKPATAEDILDNKNDIAVTLIKLGRLEEAKSILLDLIKENSNNYNVVINLGTLYELLGKNEEALKLIKKAVAINPESHSGSEWFHIKVLEFKIRHIPDAAIPNQDILKLSQIKLTEKNIEWDICYQLRERIPFTPSPNLMMAKILQEYGDFMADSFSIKAAYVIYEIGMDYDRQNVLKLDEKRNALVPYFKKYKVAVPLTNNYYTDRIIDAVSENKEQIASALLDNGLNYFKEQEALRRQKTMQRWMFAGGGAVVLLAAVYFLSTRRKKSVTEQV